jgi:hypothetical protein
MHNGIHIRISLQNLTVDKAFGVTIIRTPNRATIFDVVLADIRGARYNSGTELQREEEGRVCQGISHADVAEGVEHIVVV